MTKILFVSNLYPKSKDVENDTNTKALHNIIKNWNEDIKVIAPVFMPNEIKNFNYTLGNHEIDNISINVSKIWKVPKTDYYLYNKVIKEIKNHDWIPDVIITHRLHCAILGQRLKKILKKPLIVGLHQADIVKLNTSKNKDFYSNILSEANLLACRSQNIKRELLQQFPELRQKCFIAFSGIEEEAITNLSHTLNKIKEWKTNVRPIKFITVAVLRKAKNIDLNLRNLSKLKSDISWEYTIIGDGDELVYLKELSEELGISDRVNFLGKQPRAEVMKYLANHDIYIMVSSPETFGLSYLEAMAKGCIVVGAKNNGIDGVIEDMRDGFLIDLKLKDDFYNKLIEIIKSDLNEIIAIGINSMKTIRLYTQSEASHNYINMVRSLGRDKS